MDELTTGITDAHCHVASTDFTPRSFIEGVVTNMLGALAARGLRPDRAKLLELYLAKMQDHDCRQLVAEMDEAGIERAILLLPDFTYALKDLPLTIEEMFERHRAILQSWPERFHVFAGVDPRWGEDGLRLFERAVNEYGFRGLKLYPPCGYSPSERMLYPFYEICAQRDLPVLSHTGGTSPSLAFETSRPICLDRAALDFPSVNFIIAHGSLSYVEESLMLCAYRPNVFLEVSGFQSRPVEALAPLFARGINHKMIFGTDWPVFRMQGRQSDFVRNLRGAESPLRDLHLREVEGFFRGTIERLLTPEVSR
jgi:predicted TIM-barrel fold metal-dependent hydrolase